MQLHVVLLIAAGLVGPGGMIAPAQAETDRAEITLLYNAFGKASDMRKDWEFSAFIEYGGKRILFDTGNNAEVFAHNVRARGVDLTQLDSDIAA
ncbi:MAG: hypothetical protein OEQ18_17380 [Gammaproteobacteria bacterium]|nr:hypothetical protein [Gammaproteobacteria bacterium]